MEKFLKFVLYGIWFALLISGFWVLVFNYIYHYVAERSK